ncbi:MAG: glycosyltransferase [Bacteroidetes bacterium]|nr:glycosyltransferase [Bacteroidota bacterium]
MISIVICSVNEQLRNNIRDNIAATIGVDFELLIVSNTNNTGICKVYNDTLISTKFNFVCFVHEDVVFHTINWGKQLEILLSKNDTGLVGVSGTTYKSIYPAPWTCCDKSFYRNNTLQHFNGFENAEISNYFPTGIDFCEVAVLDGVLLAGRKEIFTRFRFDDMLLNGFHGYDIDISLAVGRKFKLLVTNNILIEHLSEGKFNKNWIKDSLVLHKKWKQSLPKSIGNRDKKNTYSDYLACSGFLNLLIINGSSKRVVSNYFFILLTKYSFYNRYKYIKSFFYYLLGHQRLISKIK